MKDGPIVVRLREKFPEDIIDSHAFRGDQTAVVRPGALPRVVTHLKEEGDLDFDFLMDLSAVDHLGREPRFEVVYHLYSLSRNHRIRLKVPLPGKDPEVETLSGVYMAADWYEREVYDMFGIRFRGHPNLRRILMYEGFQGHPLLKDYPIRKRQPIIGPQN